MTDITRLRAELARIPTYTTAEAEALVAKMDKEIRRAMKAVDRERLFPTTPRRPGEYR